MRSGKKGINRIKLAGGGESRKTEQKEGDKEMSKM
jgi:hypothetical protein